MSKTITVPENVTIKGLKVGDEVKELEFSFSTFVINNPLASNEFGGNIEALMNVAQVIQTFLNAKPGDQVEVDDDTWSKMDKLVNSPSQPYDPKLGIQLLPFLKAIREAK